jgi:G3E family GTPase
MAPTGVTVVTGFLGAGKTTLVNYVLNADHGYRVAVILNDFGASLGVEKMLVQDKPDGDNAVEEWVELNNGCVCCTVKGSLVQTIDNLLEKRAATGRKFDFILLETTGLADPGPVAQELWVDDEILEEDGAVLDAVVTLVDASNIERQLAENKEASLQIAYADTVVLNKCDTVSERDLERVEALVAGINAEAKVVRSTRSVVELGVILNQGAVSSAGRRTGVRPTLTSELATEAPAPGFWAKGVEKYAKTQPLGEVHDRSIRTICLVAEGRVDVTEGRGVARGAPVGARGSVGGARGCRRGRREPTRDFAREGRAVRGGGRGYRRAARAAGGAGGVRDNGRTAGSARGAAAEQGGAHRTRADAARGGAPRRVEGNSRLNTRNSDVDHHNFYYSSTSGIFE